MGLLTRLYTLQDEDEIYGEKLDNELNQILAVINGNIESINVKDGAITSPKLATGSVPEEALAELCVSTGKIQSNAVTGPKILDANISASKLKTSTGDGSGTLTAGNKLLVAMQDYTFFPNIECNNVYHYLMRLCAYYVAAYDNDTVGRFAIHNTHSGSLGYDYHYRYVTASDEPAVIALQNKDTGNIDHIWICDDPPPGHRGQKVPPPFFVPPIRVLDANDNEVPYNTLVRFKYPKKELAGLRNEAALDKLRLHEALSKRYDWNPGKGKFVRKVVPR